MICTLCVLHITFLHGEVRILQSNHSICRFDRELIIYYLNHITLMIISLFMYSLSIHHYIFSLKGLR
jgi:hypothetical protein